MGEVYRARDTRLDRDVAVKVLPSHLSNAPQLRERFDREARAISKLSHAHVCTLFDVGHENGVDYLVMEFLEGETLADRLSKGPLPLEQVLRYGTEIATALDKAHKQGVVHRDLKPGNVMITKAGAKVLDFGLAKYVDASSGSHPATELPTQPTQHKPLTQEGTLLGTVAYMAPEQLEGAEADARTDIFALGALLYEMTTGRRAFSGKSRASLIASIMDHEPPPLSSVAPMTPPALDRVVRTCMAKEPDDRWQSAADVARELKWIAEEPETATRVRGRRVNVPLIALAVIALVATAAAATLWLRNRDRTPLYVDISPPRGYDLVYGGLSPTGRHVAIVGRPGRGKTKLFLRALQGEEMVAIEGTDGAVNPFWSPDGLHIAFFAEDKLKRVAVAGGTPQTICDASNGTGTWNDRGVILLGSSTGGLMRVPARGGTPVPATKFEPDKRDLRHHAAEFLPDGEHFLFFLRSGDANRNGIWLGSLKDGAIRLLTAADGNGIYDSGYLLFTQRRKLFAQRFDLGSFTLEGEPIAVSDDLFFVASARRVILSAGGGKLLFQKAEERATRQLVWKSRDGRELGSAGPVVQMFHFSLSADGRRVVFEQFSDDQLGDLWLLDLGRNVVSRLTADPDWEWGAIWSRDGRRILFASNRTDESDIYEIPVNGGEWKRIVAEPGQQAPMALTPDERYLLYASNVGPRRRIKGWDFAQKRSFPVVESPAFARHSVALSPDGKRIAYCGVDTGLGEIYVEPFPPTGEKLQVTSTGGLRPGWSADGRELYYLDHEGMLYAVPMVPEPGKPVPLFQTDFRQVGERTYFTAMPDGRFLTMKDVSKRVAGPLRLIVNWTKVIED